MRDRNAKPALHFCPFCGGKAKLEESEGPMEVGFGLGSYAVVCQSCGAVGPRVEVHLGNGDADKQEAVVAWNRRAHKAKTLTAKEHNELRRSRAPKVPKRDDATEAYDPGDTDEPDDDLDPFDFGDQ